MLLSTTGREGFRKEVPYAAERSRKIRLKSFPGFDRDGHLVEMVEAKARHYKELESTLKVKKKNVGWPYWSCKTNGGLLNTGWFFVCLFFPTLPFHVLFFLYEILFLAFLSHFFNVILEGR